MDAVGMDHGDRAPCSGLLISAEDAQGCLQTTRVLFPTCQADLERADGALVVEREAFKAQLEAQSGRADRLEDLLADALRPARWYESPATAFVVGVVVASAVAITLHVAE